MVNNINKYFRSYFQFVLNSIQAEAEYRGSFVVNMIISLFWMVGAFLSISVIFSQASSIAGWNQRQIILLYLVFSIALDLFHIFVQENFEAFSNNVRHGELDWILVRPISSAFLASFMSKGFNLNPTLRLISGIVLLLYFFPTNTTIINIFMFSWFFIFGFAALYFFIFLLHAFNIWFVKLYNITHFSFTSMETIKLPLDSWPKQVKWFFIYFFPVGIISTYSVRALYSSYSTWELLSAPIVMLALFLTSQLFWKVSLRHYSSASS